LVNDEHYVEVINELEFVNDERGLMKSVSRNVALGKLLIELGVYSVGEAHLLHVIKEDLAADVLKLAEGDVLVVRRQHDLTLLDLQVQVVDDDSVYDAGHVLVQRHGLQQAQRKLHDEVALGGLLLQLQEKTLFQALGVFGVVSSQVAHLAGALEQGWQVIGEVLLEGKTETDSRSRCASRP
jgi:hypothetical protein